MESSIYHILVRQDLAWITSNICRRAGSESLSFHGSIRIQFAPRAGKWICRSPRQAVRNGRIAINLKCLLRFTIVLRDSFPDVSMIYDDVAADPRLRFQFRSSRSQIHWSPGRCVLIKSEMSPILVIVIDELASQPPDMGFIDCDHMVETFSACGADAAFRDAIFLPRTNPSIVLNVLPISIGRLSAVPHWPVLDPRR